MYYENPTLIRPQTNALYHEISMSHYYSYDSDTIPMNMYGYFSISTASGSSNLHTIQIIAAYGHTQLALSPDISFASEGLSIGISFSWYVSEEHNRLYIFSI